MKIGLRTLLFISVCTILASFSSLQDWEVYSSKEGNYRIQFPAQPKQQVQTVPSAIGDLKMYLTILESQDEKASNLLYMSAYCEYPADKLSSDAPEETVEKFFKGAEEGSAKKINGEIRSVTASNFMGYPVRNIVVDAILAGIDFVVAQRLILKKNKFYMLQVFTRKEMETNPEAKKFLDSFSFTD